MVRTMITVDGEVLWSEEETPMAIHRCFYCDTRLDRVNREDLCPRSQLGTHEWVDVAIR